MSSQPRDYFALIPYSEVKKRRKEPCAYAAIFNDWCNRLLTAFAQDPTPLMLMKVKNLLQDRYHDFYAYVDREHREAVTEDGHVCIWHIYLRTYRELREYELTYLDLSQLTDDAAGEDMDLGDLFDAEDDDAADGEA